MTSHPQFPAHLAKLFHPRPLLAPATPLDKAWEKRSRPSITAVAQFLARSKDHDQDYKHSETAQQKKEKKNKEKAELAAESVKVGLAKWNPMNDPNIQSDPYKTIIVTRLDYKASERDVGAVFEDYGPIHSIHVIRDQKTNKSRGYAFVEFKNEKDAQAAVKYADGIKVLDRRVLVDVERGRAGNNFRPRRLGGGLGGTRIGPKYENYIGKSKDDPLVAPTRPLGGRDFDRDRRDDRRDFDRRDDRRRDDRNLPPPRRDFDRGPPPPPAAREGDNRPSRDWERPRNDARAGIGIDVMLSENEAEVPDVIDGKYGEIRQAPLCEDPQPPKPPTCLYVSSKVSPESRKTYNSPKIM
ncbi:hypothetical protein SeLEV6574_g06693 [Synchytrium endobioticum]|uniref:RRM domain-containing protein n=1 Tax=Synchytrium endobioticum TaxID=286115 RepID=A0A507CKF0_9FUNG|nr:hypothetical protein SeLEV6574_g06693 [Synchytrium endobioticum]